MAQYTYLIIFLAFYPRILYIVIMDDFCITTEEATRILRIPYHSSAKCGKISFIKKDNHLCCSFCNVELKGCFSLDSFIFQIQTLYSSWISLFEKASKDFPELMKREREKKIYEIYKDNIEMLEKRDIFTDREFICFSSYMGDIKKINDRLKRNDKN